MAEPTTIQLLKAEQEKNATLQAKLDEQTAMAVARQKQIEESTTNLARKEQELVSLRASKDAEKAAAIAGKDAEIAILNGKLDSFKFTAKATDADFTAKATEMVNRIGGDFPRHIDGVASMKAAEIVAGQGVSKPVKVEPVTAGQEKKETDGKTGRDLVSAVFEADPVVEAWKKANPKRN